MKKKFAFILMGGHYNPELHQAQFETETEISYIYTVRNFEEACEKVKLLAEDNIGALELCGAFGEEKAKILTELTNHKIAIGYVIHDPSQDYLFDQFFNK